MYLIYFDECKYEETRQPYYWLCGLAVPDHILKEVEGTITDIVGNYFGTKVLSKSNEIHAYEIIHGKGVFKGKPLSERVELFKRMVKVINDFEEIFKITVRIDPAKMIADGIEDKAFMFFVEKANGLMRGKKTLGLLIGDFDKEVVSQNVKGLSVYKNYGTNYAFQREIKNIADTVHYTKSHHSRMLQLADIYTYSMLICSQEQSKYPRDEIKKYIHEQTNVAFPSTYKYWPTDMSWYKKA
ncbi:DUF3800 domain-containing protein [Thermodesulfobacteriota bacterium]